MGRNVIGMINNILVQDHPGDQDIDEIEDIKVDKLYQEAKRVLKICLEISQKASKKLTSIRFRMQRLNLLVITHLKNQTILTIILSKIGKETMIGNVKEAENAIVITGEIKSVIGVIEYEKEIIGTGIETKTIVADVTV